MTVWAAVGIETSLVTRGSESFLVPFHASRTFPASGEVSETPVDELAEFLDTLG